MDMAPTCSKSLVTNLYEFAERDQKEIEVLQKRINTRKPTKMRRISGERVFISVKDDYRSA